MSVLKITTITCSLLFAIATFVTIAFLNRTADSSPVKTPLATQAANPATHEPATDQDQGDQKPMKEDQMQLGNFSVSLTVKDIKASKKFYEKLDFQQVAGKLEQNWVVMQNGTITIGLFQGMFEANILTFNPGWNAKKETLEKFQDVRELQATIKERGITPVTEADAATTGPASFVIVDPDGNSILFDQHVPKPK